MIHRVARFSRFSRSWNGHMVFVDRVEGKTLSATSRLSLVSRAITAPIPPAPSGATISYGPSLVPEVRAIVWLWIIALVSLTEAFCRISCLPDMPLVLAADVVAQSVVRFVDSIVQEHFASTFRAGWLLFQIDLSFLIRDCAARGATEPIYGLRDDG
jgi:hypothetical protein